MMGLQNIKTGHMTKTTPLSVVTVIHRLGLVSCYPQPVDQI